MKRTIFTTAIFALLLLCGGVVMGQSNLYPSYDFTSVNADGDTLYYRITSSEVPYTVAVTRCHDSIFHTLSIPQYEQEVGQPGFAYPVYDYDTLITIPSTVLHDGISYSVTSIDKEAFYYQKGMRTVVLPNSVSVIDTCAFCFSSLAHIEMPRVTKLCYGAFYSAELSSVQIPESVTVIEPSAFLGNLFTNVEVPSSISVLENYVFSFCSELSVVNLPEHLVSIQEGAFYATPRLRKITIPSEVTYIGPWTFEASGYDGAFYLDTVIMECVTPPELCNELNSFIQNKDLLIIVPCHTATTYQTAPIWSDYSNMIYVEDCVGVEEYELEEVKTYPNPATDILHITVTDGEIARVEMTDMFGRNVSVETHGRASLPSQQTTVNTSALPAGVYILRLTLRDGAVRTTKVVKR